jgi:hypothetical protein
MGHMLPQLEQWRSGRRFVADQPLPYDFLDNLLSQLKPLLDMPQQCR